MKKVPVFLLILCLIAILLTGCNDSKVRLWNVDNGQLVETFTGHRGWVSSVAFTPDGTQAVSTGGARLRTGGVEAGPDFVIRLWNLPAFKPRVAN